MKVMTLVFFMHEKKFSSSIVISAKKKSIKSLK